MRRKLLILFATVLGVGNAFSGDDASGPIRYRVDLGQAFTTHQLSAADRAWAAEIARRLNYTGTIVHFVRTSIPLQVDNEVVEGAVYQAVEHPTFFYVVPGDAMLALGTTWPYSPGVGGFSMHAPKSLEFIACLNFVTGGVPFLSSTPVVKGTVSWGGNADKRF